MNEYLTGAALYRAMADMLDGGREVQMLHTTGFGSHIGGNWGTANGIHLAYRYRLKPVEKRTVTIGYQNEYGNGCWKTLIAPEVEAPPMGAVYYLFSVSDFVVQDWENIECELGWLVQGRVFLTGEDAQAMADWLTKCRLGQTS